MKALLSDDLWVELKRRSRHHKRLHAAIAYVTAEYLGFRHGDLLICDASDAAISGGQTSAKTLAAFVRAGAEVYSFKGLHSKVAVIDHNALIGSANLSAAAGVATCEASLWTDDRQVVGLVEGFIEEVRRRADRVDSAFLKRIGSLPVTRRLAIRRRSKTKIRIGRARVWLIATDAISDDVEQREKTMVELGKRQARKHLVNSDDDMRWIRWTGTSQFRRTAKAGDLAVEVFTERKGRKKSVSVYPPAPIIHRMDHDEWTRFYLEVPEDHPQKEYRWSDVKADLAKLGVKNVSPSSIRELKGRAASLPELLE